MNKARRDPAFMSMADSRKQQADELDSLIQRAERIVDREGSISEDDLFDKLHIQSPFDAGLRSRLRRYFADPRRGDKELRAPKRMVSGVTRSALMKQEPAK